MHYNLIAYLQFNFDILLIENFPTAETLLVEVLLNALALLMES